MTLATSSLYCFQAEVGPDPDYRSRLRQDSAFFFRTWSKKFVKNRIRCHFFISGVAGVCVVISLVKTWVNYGWMDDCCRSLNRLMVNGLLFHMTQPTSRSIIKAIAYRMPIVSEQ